MLKFEHIINKYFQSIGFCLKYNPLTGIVTRLFYNNLFIIFSDIFAAVKPRTFPHSQYSSKFNISAIYIKNNPGPGKEIILA